MSSSRSPLPPVPVDLVATMTAWRNQHPNATLADIEHAADAQLADVRAALIAGAGMIQNETAPPSCPDCGGRMHRSGRRSRTVTTAHNGVISLTGPTYHCPACGAGLFPPQ